MEKILYYYRKAALAYHHPPLLIRKIRQYYLRLTSFSLQQSLIQAYDNADSPANIEMHRLARAYYGLETVPAHTLRAANDFRRRLFFARHRLFRKGVRHQLGAWSIGFKGLKIQCASDSFLESMIYTDGFYEELTILKVYESLLSHGDYAVDVGANIGVHSLAMSRVIADTGKVFAYEANPLMAIRMHRNVKLNAVTNIEVRQTALGDTEGEIRFYNAAREFNQGLGHQDPKGDLIVPVVTLDKDLKNRERPIALMKIDVEGMELRVVRGAHEILKCDRPAIVLEFNSPPWRLRELIANIPYTTHIYRIPDTFNGVMRPVESQVDLVGFNNLLILSSEVSKQLLPFMPTPKSMAAQEHLRIPDEWDREPESMLGMIPTTVHKFSQKVLGEAGLRVLSTLFVLLLARSVGAVDFGRYATAMAYAAFCAVIVDLGTNFILVREIARNPDGRLAIASTSHLLKILASIVAWLMLAGLTYLMNFSVDDRQLTLCMGIVVIGYTMTDYFSALLNGLEEMGWEALLKVLSRGLALSLALLAIARHQSLPQIIDQLAWGALLSYAACVLIVRQRFHSFGVAFNGPLLKSLLRSTLPLFGFVIFWALYDSQDVLLLNYFHFAARDIGYFSAAMKVIEVFRVYPILLLGVFFPVLTKLHVTDPEAFSRKWKRLSTFMFISLALLGAMVYLSATVIIRVLYNTDFSPAALYLRLLSPALVLIGLNYSQVQVLIAINRERMLLTAAWLACAVNLLLAIFLVPKFGVPGTCYALLGSELFYFLFLRRAAAGT